MGSVYGAGPLVTTRNGYSDKILQIQLSQQIYFHSSLRAKFFPHISI